MKFYEPKTAIIEIEENEMEILKEAYNLLEDLSDKIAEFEGKNITYSAFGMTENNFYEFLSEMKDYISEATNDW